MTTVTLPPVTPAFRDAVRTLGCQIGWRNVAKMIAYGPTINTEAIGSNGNGHKRNGSRKAYTLAYYDAKGLHFSTYERCKIKDEWHTGWQMACEQAHELERTRFERPIPYPFTPAQPAIVKALDETDVRLALYPARECCGSPMGIMESWGILTVTEYQKTKNGYDETPIKAVYQCAVNAAHREDAYPTSRAASKSKRAEKPRREA